MAHQPLANPSVVLREEFDDFALLYNPDKNEVFCLNPVGVFLWKRFDGSHTVGDILKELGSNCNEMPDDAGEHLMAFIGVLEKRGLITVNASQGA